MLNVNVNVKCKCKRALAEADQRTACAFARQVQSGVNETADELLAAIEANEAEIAPSTIFAVASILEGSM